MAYLAPEPRIHQQFLLGRKRAQQPDKPQLLVAGQLMLKGEIAHAENLLKSSLIQTGPVVRHEIVPPIHFPNSSLRYFRLTCKQSGILDRVKMRAAAPWLRTLADGGRSPCFPISLHGMAEEKRMVSGEYDRSDGLPGSSQLGSRRTHCRSSLGRLLQHIVLIGGLHSHRRRMAPRAGFEPATCRLTVECSTAELPGNNRSVAACERGNTNAFPICQALFQKKTNFLV